MNKDDALKLSGSTAASRRSFIKTVAMTAAAPAAIALQQAVAQPGGMGSSFIRVKRSASTSGWKYYRVSTVAECYPPLPNEKEFVPSVYGGNLAVIKEESGKFRTEKINGRWWLIDPNGHPFLSTGLNSISPFSGESLLRSVIKMGEQKWSSDTVKMLRSIGINTAGYWSKASIHRGHNPHAEMAYVYYNFGQKGDKPTRGGAKPQGLMQIFAANNGAEDQHNPVFHADFVSFCEERCKMVSALKDDPWLLGYFTDNELKMPSLNLCLKWPVEHPVYGGTAKEARRWLAESSGETKVSDITSQKWLAHCFDWYYRVTTSAVRLYDADHLQLGSRVYSVERNNSEVLAAAGRYLDVISINPYGPPALSPFQLKQWSQWAGDKPVMIGEFYVKGQDAELSNSRGAGLTVSSQEERGLYYQNYVINLLKSGCCVGWHWHRYSDAEEKVGTQVGASNKGIVARDLNAYRQVFEKIGEINNRIHQITARAGVI